MDDNFDWNEKTDGDPEHAWIEINFNERYTLTKIKTRFTSGYGGNEEVNNFKDVKFSFSDGTEKIRQRGVYDTWVEWRHLQLDPAVQTTFVRASSTGSYDCPTCNIGFSEIRFYGCRVNSKYVYTNSYSVWRFSGQFDYLALQLI